MTEILYRWADDLSIWVGVRNWAWSLRMAIAVFFDFVLDIPLLIFFAPISWIFPPAGALVHTFFDIFLTFVGIILWGRVGYWQAAEVFLGIGHSFFLDLIPWLTIGGFIARRREARNARDMIVLDEVVEEDEQEVGRANFGGGVMTGLLAGAVGGLLFGLLYSWLEVVTGWGVAGLTIIGSLLGLVAYGLRNVLSEGAVMILAGIGAVFLGVVLGRVAYLKNMTTPEDYRQVAWRELEQSGDALIAGAKKLDDFGKTEGVQAAKELASGLLDRGKETLKEKLEEIEETGIGIVDGFVDSLKGVVKKREEKKKEAEKQTPETARLEKEAKSLELGSAQARLYRSDRVLERASQIRQGLVSFWSWFSQLPVMLLLFAGILFTQIHFFGGDGGEERPLAGRRNFNPDPNLDF